MIRPSHISTAVAFALAAVALAPPAPRAEQRVVEVESAAELEQALASPLEGVTIRLAAGEYHLTPGAAVDSTCGNCEDPDQRVDITVGARISGRSVWIEGPETGGAIIYTHAGYGLLFEDCDDCRIENVTVTGGERDEAAEATDAAIVARRSNLRVHNCVIRDNIGDPDLLAKNVVGIMGVCGREGADLMVYESRIIRNSWDGIALYRDARARIYNNVIDGVNQASGDEAGGGRGVGIGVTWNATARIERNLVRRYWKGIGVFVDAKAQIVGNIVEEMTTWGIAYWAAGSGRPSAAIGSNIVYDCGACGVLISREAPLEAGEYASLTANLVVRTGQNPKYDDPGKYCAQCAVDVAAEPAGFRERGNVFFNNRRGSDDLPDLDVSEPEFRRRLPHIIMQVVTSPESYTARVVFRESSFLKAFAN